MNVEPIKPVRSLVLHKSSINAVEVEYKKERDDHAHMQNDDYYRGVGITADLKNDDPIIWSIRDGHFKEIQFLVHAFPKGIERDRLLNRRDKYGNTALHLAVAAGCVPVVEVLLFHGADPNAKNHRFNTPLHHTCAVNDTRLSKLLLEHGARVDVPNWQNKTCTEVTTDEHSEYVMNYFQHFSTLQHVEANYSVDVGQCCRELSSIKMDDTPKPKSTKNDLENIGDPEAPNLHSVWRYLHQDVSDHLAKQARV